MSREILLLVDALAHEKNVTEEVIFIALELMTLMCECKLIGKPVNTKPIDAGNTLSMICWRTPIIKSTKRASKLKA